jgi:hypothetical protein
MSTGTFTVHSNYRPGLIIEVARSCSYCLVNSDGKKFSEDFWTTLLNPCSASDRIEHLSH